MVPYYNYRLEYGNFIFTLAFDFLIITLPTPFLKFKLFSIATIPEKMSKTTFKNQEIPRNKLTVYMYMCISISAKSLF